MRGNANVFRLGVKIIRRELGEERENKAEG